MVLTAPLVCRLDYYKIKGCQIEVGDANGFITCSRCCLAALPAVSNCWDNNIFSVAYMGTCCCSVNENLYGFISRVQCVTKMIKTWQNRETVSLFSSSGHRFKLNYQNSLTVQFYWKEQRRPTLQVEEGTVRYILMGSMSTSLWSSLGWECDISMNTKVILISWQAKHLKSFDKYTLKGWMLSTNNNELQDWFWLITTCILFWVCFAAS